MAADNDARLQISLIGVFAFLLLGIGAANYLFYHAESTASRERAQAELVAIADLKAREIDNWRRERLAMRPPFATILRSHRFSPAG